MRSLTVALIAVFVAITMGPAVLVAPRLPATEKSCLFVVPSTTLARDGISALEKNYDEIWRIPPLPEDAGGGLGARSDVCVCSDDSCAYCRASRRTVSLVAADSDYAPSVRNRIGHWMVLERALSMVRLECNTFDVIGLTPALRHPMLEVGKPLNGEVQDGFSHSLRRILRRFPPRDAALGLRHSACVPDCLTRTAAPALVLHGNESARPQDLGQSLAPQCAIVGNSDSLLATQWGPAIDFHDVVVRINRFPLHMDGTGRALVGRKMTHWYLNTALCLEFFEDASAFAPFHDTLFRMQRNVTLFVAPSHVPLLKQLTRDLPGVRVGLPPVARNTGLRSRVAAAVRATTGPNGASTSGMGVALEFIDRCRSVSVFGLSDGGGLLMPGEQPVRAGLTCLAALAEGGSVRCFFLRSEACTLTCLLDVPRNSIRWTPASSWESAMPASN